MPLVAIVDSQRLEAPSMDDASWEQLRATYKQTGLELVCGQSGYPRTSKLGLRHFVHHTAGCGLHADSGPETQEHLASKAALAAAARAAGWTATIEYVGPEREWIADVMIERGGTRVALEAQWSPQTPEEFVRRTQRYAGAGMRTIWFVGPKNHAHAGEDRYKLDGRADGLVIELPGRVFEQATEWQLTEGATALFMGRFRKRVEVRSAGALILAKMGRCYACNQWITHWWLHGVVVDTRCGKPGRAEMFTDPLPLRKQALEPALNADLLRELAAHFAPPTTHRTVKTQEGGEYIGQVCPRCGRVQGDFHLSTTKRRAQIYVVPVSPGVDLDRSLTAVHHQCDDIGRGRCTPQPPTRATFPGPAETGLVQFDAFYDDDFQPLPERRH
ncbi:competence protein CoiA [Leifsonia sp. P73]|uniref:competence protein CoiA n=1 Tax=Leifsonia sp. P73 TaxID=3423959 RepID=UPI003DA479FF